MLVHQCYCKMTVFHSLLWLSSIPLCVYTHTPHHYPFTPLSIHLSLDICFSVLAIVKSAAMNIGVPCFFLNWFCLDMCPGVGLLDHMLILSFLRNHHTASGF